MLNKEMFMKEIENTTCYKPGDTIWWYDDSSRLRHGIVRQIIKQNDITLVYADEGYGTCHTVLLRKCWPAKWVAQFIWHWTCLCQAMLLYSVWGILWAILELLIYREIQHRIVDDIISIPVIVMLYLMFRYKKERDSR